MTCYCGKELDHCSFWCAIQKQLGIPLSSLQLKPFFLRSNFQRKPVRKLLKKAIWLLLQLFPGLYRVSLVQRVLGGDRAAVESVELYRATNAAHGGSYVLDSSKTLFRLHTMFVRSHLEIKVILLCRDYRGVVSSKVKRGMDIRKAAYQWKWVCRQMDIFTRDMPSSNVFRVKYEDLCQYTEGTMRNLMQFLELPFEEAVLSRSHNDLHHLGGSPSKYNRNDGPLGLDDSYKTILSEQDVSTAANIVSPQSTYWGYE